MIGEGGLSYIYQRGGALFANFPTWAMTGCSIFRPLVTGSALSVISTSQVFFFFPFTCSFSPPLPRFIFSRTALTRAICLSRGGTSLHSAVEDSDQSPVSASPLRDCRLPVCAGLPIGQRPDKSQSFLVKVKVSTPLHQN